MPAPKAARSQQWPKATVIRNYQPLRGGARQHLFSPGRDLAGQRMVIVEKNGPWLRVFANTDEEISKSQDAPVFGHESCCRSRFWMDAGRRP